MVHRKLYNGPRFCDEVVALISIYRYHHRFEKTTETRLQESSRIPRSSRVPGYDALIRRCAFYEVCLLDVAVLIVLPS